MASLTIEVDLDELAVPESPTSIMTETINDIITRVEEQASPRRNTAEQINESYGTFITLDDDGKNKCCPTCGVHSAWTNVDYSHRICLPTIGPAKPRRIQDVFGSELGQNLHFDTVSMTPAERVATGGNIFRCQTVCTGTCAICMQPCQEQGPSQWQQFTGWEWCCSYCWKDLCWRYHTEYLEPNGYVNTLGRFLVFLEE